MSQKRKRSYSVMCTCVVCEKRFRASRTDAKYHDDACRKKASRDRVGQKKKSNVSDTSQMTMDQLETLLSQAQINARIDRLFA